MKRTKSKTKAKPKRNAKPTPTPKPAAAKTPKPAGAKSAQAPARSGVWRQVNRVQLSALVGVHEDTISDMTRRGMPVKNSGGRGVESVYDAVDCLDWWRSQQGKNKKEIEQTRFFAAQADTAEMKLARERKDLVSRQDVVRAGRAYTLGWSTQLQTLAARARQAGVIRPDQEAGLDRLARETLSDIAAWKTLSDAITIADGDNDPGAVLESGATVADVE